MTNDIPRPGCLSDNTVYDWYMMDREAVVKYVEWLERQRDTYKFIANSHEKMLDAIQTKLDQMVADYEITRTYAKL